METVLTAFIVIFIILFAMLTLSDAFLSSQDTLQVTWQEMEGRWSDQARTSLGLVSADTTNNGTFIEFILENEGTTRLANFEEWDVIIQYYDTAPDYQIGWLPYTGGALANNEWTVEGIYLDAAEAVAEVYEPDILNPGEELVLQVQVAPPVGPAAATQISLVTPYGVSLTTNFLGNSLPVLTTNTGTTLASGATEVINSLQLDTSDADDEASELIYTVTVDPAEGSLNLGTSFTQDDIDNGLLSYEHTGSDVNDSFQFTVTDGKDTIGAYIFDLTISVPPVLATNTGMTLPIGGSLTIDNLMLRTTDVDDLPADLNYAIVTFPAQGNLNLGGSFTQGDIDGSLLSYTHTGIGNDSFQFTVSDGETLIGIYTFTIIVV